eukprot:10998466-Alexandrium_andersonii.AAC.1
MPALGLALVVPEGGCVLNHSPSAFDLGQNLGRGGGSVAVIGVDRHAKASSEGLNLQGGESRTVAMPSMATGSP